MSISQDIPSREPPLHPEEISADYELRVGNLITVQASARITPAGIISAGIAAAAIVVAVGFLISSTGGRSSERELKEPDLRRLEGR